MKPPLSTKERQIEQIREASRSIFRFLGMLAGAHSDLGVSNSEVHALIELERTPELGVAEIARLLNLDKSTVSRLVDGLIARKLVESSVDQIDARRKQMRLSQKGQTTLDAVHAQARDRVGDAISKLPAKDIAQITDGLTLYAQALGETLNGESKPSGSARTNVQAMSQNQARSKSR